MKYSLLGLMCTLALLTNTGVSIAKDELTITNGRKVTFDYTLTVDGQVVDTSKGQKPIEYTQGAGGIIPGLAKQLEGLRVGDEKAVVVGAKDAYGEVDQTAFREVAKSSLPPGIAPQVGMMLAMKGADGHNFPVIISAVNQDMVTLNFNHPLAGKELHFQVKILTIQ